MIRGLYGRTGGGKTLTLVNKLVLALLHTERTQCTNLEEIVLPRLNEYLQERREAENKKHPARALPPVDLDKRLIIIPKQETRHFFRYRSGGLILPVFQEADPKTGKRISLEEFNERIEQYWAKIWERQEWCRGVDYYMSECHRFFPAREYQAFARTMGFWATQNRHFDDNAWIESQFPMQIDANFRELAVEWFHVRNHGREVMGMFRKRAVFSWRMFYEMPKSDKVAPDDKGEFRLDAAGVASCYKTRGAVKSALADMSPEEPPKNRKLPFWMFPAAIIGLILIVGIGIMFLPLLAQKGIAVAVSSAAGAAEAGVAEGLGLNAAPAPRRSMSGPALATPDHPPGIAPAAIAVPASPEAPRPVGWVRRAGQIFVVMSDGTRRWYSHDQPGAADFQRLSITPSVVEIDGQRHFLRATVPPAATSAPRQRTAAAPVAPQPPPVYDLPPLP